MQATWCWLLVASVFLTSSPLSAQLLPAEPAASPSAPSSGAELPPEREESQLSSGPAESELVAPGTTRHVHDGFFLRVTLGFAILYANIEPRFVGAAERNLFTSGPAWSFELGGTPLRGLAIGPLYYGSVSFSLLRNRTKPGSMTDHYRLHALGLFAAWFPSQTKGLELGGTIMWAPLQVAIQEVSGASVRTSSTYLSGISPGVSAGYTGWISPNGALGVLFRVAMGWHASDDASATSFASMLLLNFLYH